MTTQDDIRAAAKKKYEDEHGISSRNQEIGRSSGIGQGTKQPDKRPNEITGYAQQQGTGETGSIRYVDGDDKSGKGSTRERDRGNGVGAGTYEYGYGGINQNSSTGNGDVGQRTEEDGVDDFAPDSSSIINVATVPTQKRGRGRPKGSRTTTTERTPIPDAKTQPVRAVVVDVLKGMEVEVTRKRLRSAFIGTFKALDDWINLTLEEKPPRRLEIWSAIDDDDINILVEARITRAQVSAIEARLLKGFITVYEQFASGFITLPRLYMSYQAYALYGFQLPGAELRRSRKRTNLRVVGTTGKTEQPANG